MYFVFLYIEGKIVSSWTDVGGADKEISFEESYQGGGVTISYSK